MVTVERKFLDFLTTHGASETEHSGCDFLSHLKGTFQILKDWEQSDRVCVAGLFHSVYGTEVFVETLIPSDLRPVVSKLIGDDAERLTYYFGIMDRERFLGQLNSAGPFHIKNRQTNMTYELSQKEFMDLCHIYVANRLEQHPRWPDEYRFCESEEMAQMQQHLCKKAWTDLKKEYRI